ncbi:MAG: hypothetical protein P8X63_13600 [Desulfuromonadaceae bacterium]
MGRFRVIEFQLLQACNAHNLDPRWVRRLPAGIIFTRKTKEPDSEAHDTLNIRQPYNLIPGDL